MKAISHAGIITSISSRADGSLGYRMTTPELSPAEKADFMGLQNANIEVLLKPMDEEPSDALIINKELENKPLHIRLRNAIFRVWKLKQEAKEFDNPDNFEELYRRVMEGFIEVTKEKMEEYGG